MMADKRKSPPVDGYANGSLVKRARAEDAADEEQEGMLTVAIGSGAGNEKAVTRTIKRTSGLSSPIVSLAGAHGAEILDCKFDPTGQNIAAASADKMISLWRAYGANTNYGILKGHSKAVTALVWSRTSSPTSPRLYSASADGTLIVWDASTGEKVRRLRGHKGIVNALACTRGGREILVSGGDDGRVCLWDPEDKHVLDTIEVGYPITAVEFSEDGSQVFVGSIDNDIHAYDLRRKTIVYSLRGHTDTIAALSLSPSGSHLLSTAFDDTVRIWDVSPFSPSTRLHRTLTGVTSGFEQVLFKPAWSPDGERVAAGGADRTCTIWDVEKSQILYKLPGHKGMVTCVDFHPQEPIILSGSIDRTMFLGEIEPSG